MLLTQEQISAAKKANLETLAQLSRKTFDGVEKLMELNLQVAKTLMQENVEHIQDSSKAKDIKDYFAMQASFIQPLTEKAISYSRHFYNIANETQTELTEVSKSDMQNRAENIQKMMADMTVNIPGSSDAMVNLIKQAVANANATFESTQKAVKQAIDMSNHQTQAATESALKASEKIFKKASSN